MAFKPMKGEQVRDEDFARLVFPMILGPKIDGFRCVVPNGQPLSSSLKPLPNRFMNKTILENLDIFNGLDGELTVGAPHKLHPDDDVFDRASPLRREHGEPDFTLHAFDLCDRPDVRFTQRLAQLTERLAGTNHPHIQLVKQKLIRNLDELDQYESDQLELGYEGVMGRSLDGPYKHGKSSVLQGYLVKIKRRVDSEAVIIGFEEEMFNGNEAKKNELGRTARSSAKAGKVGKGRLGKFIVRVVNGPFAGVTVKVGTGISHALRQEIWDNQAAWLGRYITFRWMPIGSKDAPRHPVYIRDRPDFDVEIAA